jgi:hypothetical protein
MRTLPIRETCFGDLPSPRSKNSLEQLLDRFIGGRAEALYTARMWGAIKL